MSETPTLKFFNKLKLNSYIAIFGNFNGKIYLYPDTVLYDYDDSLIGDSKNDPYNPLNLLFEDSAIRKNKNFKKLHRHLRNEKISSIMEAYTLMKLRDQMVEVTEFKP